MTHTAYPALKKRRRERPSGATDNSNPFDRRAPGTKVVRPKRNRSASGLRLEIHRQALVALRERLRGNVVQTADAALSSSIETASASPDTADRASETVEQDLALGLLGSAAGRLDQIDAALERIEDGSYGRCAECETEIPAARLEAIPYATCCVECAAQRERAG